MKTEISYSRAARPMLSTFKIGTAAALLAVTALVSSCGAMRTDRQTTSSIPDDYRNRHPITLAEVEHNLDVPVGTGQARLTPGTRDIVKGFAQDYLALSRGTIAVAVPVGSANSAAANAVRSEIRRSLADAGIASTRIIQTNYTPQSPDVSAPVRLSFIGVTAITDDCGQWPSDLFGPTVVDNTNWENFGCATQQNLAAQIANPADLVGPRGMTPIDAQRRAEVIRIYREG